MMGTEVEVCMVMGCGLTKAVHADRNHEFSSEGQLIPKRQQPPARRVSTTPESSLTAAMMTRLLAVLMKKGILDEVDLSFVTGGSYQRPPDSPGDLPDRPTSG